ncbi:hypothetical protein HYH03_012461 [Edaphochlamys debaryana]|uniref:Uncharacterized protein n=1 Tax=Edaphochlamys debaryana TaxID=47281 RepID=A0A835XU22_9CHLO|nr:hypothetical protein HYH03_012461 [Edaphochlamys debaryana]|eukprot:KAG2489023.1 hypothetical protein HYH03_012461 [Edaphochlamys debaryana]
MTQNHVACLQLSIQRKLDENKRVTDALEGKLSALKAELAAKEADLRTVANPDGPHADHLRQSCVRLHDQCIRLLDERKPLRDERIRLLDERKQLREQRMELLRLSFDQTLAPSAEGPFKVTAAGVDWYLGVKSPITDDKLFIFNGQHEAAGANLHCSPATLGATGLLLHNAAPQRCSWQRNRCCSGRRGELGVADLGAAAPSQQRRPRAPDAPDAAAHAQNRARQSTSAHVPPPGKSGSLASHAAGASPHVLGPSAANSASGGGGGGSNVAGAAHRHLVTCYSCGAATAARCSPDGNASRRQRSAAAAGLPAAA